MLPATKTCDAVASRSSNPARIRGVSFLESRRENLEPFNERLIAANHGKTKRRNPRLPLPFPALTWQEAKWNRYAHRPPRHPPNRPWSCCGC